MIATVDDLDAITVFDIAFEVSDGNNVTTRLDIYTPGIIDGEIESSDWEFFSHGYTGQYGYNGPIMHNSEFIGGRLAKDILNTPGIYVVVAAFYTNDDDVSANGGDFEGWAVLRYAGE